MMKNFKHLLVVVLCLALVFAFMFSMSSCKKDDKNDDATPGDTTNDGTGDNGGNNGTNNNPEDPMIPENPENPENPDNPNAHVHSYVGTILKFPSAGVDGERLYSCSCGDSYTEKISAVGVELPSLADALAAIIGENEYSAAIGDGTTLIRVRELSDYENSTGSKDFLAIKVGEVSISGKGATLKAAVSFEIGVESIELDGTNLDAAPSTFETIFKLNAFVDGDKVLVETVENGEADTIDIENISEMIYTALAQNMGMTYDQFKELYVVASQAGDYLPLLGGLIELVASIEIPEANVGILDVFTLIGEGIISVETDAAGNVTYSLDVQHLNDLLATVEDKTVAEILDAEFGEGTADALAGFITGIPTKTVKQIAESAIAFSEGCGVPIESIYSLVNYVVFTATGVEFDIEAQIESRYNYSLALLLAELEGVEDMAAFETKMISTVNEMVGLYMGYTIDDIYNAYCGYAEGEFSITANIKSLVDMLDGYTTLEAQLDAEGNLISATATVAEFSVSILVEGDVITISQTEGEYELLNAKLTLGDNGALVGAVINVNAINYDYEPVTDENGDYVYDEFGEVVYETIESLEKAFALTYTDDLAGNATVVLTTEYATVTVNVTTTELDGSTTVEAVIGAVDNSDSTPIFNGTLLYNATVNGETLDVTLTDGETTVTVEGEYTANHQLIVAELNSNVMFKYEVLTAVNAEGMEELLKFEWIVGDLVNEASKVNGEYVYDRDVYYETVHVSYVKNDDGTVDFSIATKDSYRVGTEIYDDVTGDWIGWEDHAVINDVINATVNYDGNSTVVLNVNGMEIVFTYEALNNGGKLTAEFEMGGDAFTATATLTDTGLTVTVVDDANTVLSFAIVSDSNGVSLDFIVNGYVLNGEYDENGDFVVTDKDFYNFLNVHCGIDNGFVLDVYYGLDDGAFLDGAINVVTGSTSNSESITISVDLDKLYTGSDSYCTNEDGNHDVFGYCEVVVDENGNVLGLLEEFDEIPEGAYIATVCTMPEHTHYYIWTEMWVALTGSITFTHSW